MSEFHVEVVRVGPCVKHENADTLSITRVRGDYPVIFRTGEFKEGDLAVYVPVDSLVPDTEQWSFLGGHRRIKAKRLRGVFSMGLLTQVGCTCDRSEPGPWKSIGETEELAENHLEGCPRLWKLGQNVQAEMGILKWEPVVHAGRLSYAENEPDQPFMPRYTDIEGLRRYGNVLVPGETVVVTEKIHGANGRWLWRDGRFWVGSHNYLKKEDPRDLWWRALLETGLAEKIARAENMLFFGEVYGKVQDLNYGVGDGIDVRVFDVFDTSRMRYLDFHDMNALTLELGIAVVPQLHIGPWSEDLRSLAEGKTTLGGNHIREGIVVRPTEERWNDRCGRVILKLIGEGYMLRKDG